MNAMINQLPRQRDDVRYLVGQELHQVQIYIESLVALGRGAEITIKSLEGQQLASLLEPIQDRLHTVQDWLDEDLRGERRHG